MQYDNFEISASPFICRVSCPKCRSDMIELDNGWFSKAWWCKKCQKPYTLKMVAMKKWNKEAVDKQLVKLTPPLIRVKMNKGI